MRNYSRWVLGNGSHALEVAEAWLAAGGTIAGFIDRTDRPRPQVDYPVVAEAAIFERIRRGEADSTLLFGIGCIAASTRRIVVAERLHARGIRFDTAIHPRAYVSPRAQIATGSAVLAGAIIAANVRVEELCIVNHAAVVDHDAELAKGVHIAPGAILGGNVVVETASMIGAGAVVKQGTRIGAGSTVGAGSVVIRDVLPGGSVAGNPARQL